MSNEIKLTISFKVENGNYKDVFAPGQIQIDQASPGRGGHVQVVGTTEETIDFGDVSTNGLLILRNLDSTNYVQYGPQVGTGNMEVWGKLLPGEIAAMRLAPTVVMRAQADTASVKLDVRLYEN